MRKHYDYLYFKYYKAVVREFIWDTPDSKVQAVYVRLCFKKKSDKIKFPKWFVSLSSRYKLVSFINTITTFCMDPAIIFN